jgi:hypothetical protein
VWIVIKTRSIEPELPGAPAARRRGDLVLALLVAILLTPIAYESAARCAARWRSMVGPSVAVETPVLDAIHAALSRGVYILRYQLASTFNNTPWKPSVVIACGLVFALLTSLPLRRTH